MRRASEPITQLRVVALHSGMGFEIRVEKFVLSSSFQSQIHVPVSRPGKDIKFLASETCCSENRVFS